MGLAAVVQGETGCLFYRNMGRGCDACTACREMGPAGKTEGKEKGWKSWRGELWECRILAATAGRAMTSALRHKLKHSQPPISGYQHNSSPSAPRFPGTGIFSPLASFSLHQKEFLLSISSPTISPMAHKIIKRSPKLEQPLTLPSRSPIARINTSTLHH